MTTVRSTLHSHDTRLQAAELAVAVLCAALLHALAYFGFIAVAWLDMPWIDSQPVVEPDDFMEVSMVMLPKSPDQFVHRATQAPTPEGSPDILEEPAPTETIPNPSDLTIHKEEPEPQPKGVNKPKPNRMDELRRLALIAEASDDAATADRTQQASDPNSPFDEHIQASGPGTMTDAELAKYLSDLEALFKKNFHPLPTIVAANPDLVCTIRVRLDPATGRVQSANILKASGNPSFDGAAERAAQSITQVPLPPGGKQFDQHLIEYSAND